MNLAFLKKQFAASIKNARVARKMTQADLAKRSLVSIATIKRIESGGNQKINDYLRLVSVLNSKMTDRLYDAIKFDAGDYTDDPMTSIELTVAVDKTRRVRA